jgi:hypothetical protein
VPAESASGQGLPDGDPEVISLIVALIVWIVLLGTLSGDP